MTTSQSSVRAFDMARSLWAGMKSALRRGFIVKPYGDGLVSWYRIISIPSSTSPEKLRSVYRCFLLTDLLRLPQ